MNIWVVILILIIVSAAIEPSKVPKRKSQSPHHQQRGDAWIQHEPMAECFDEMEDDL